MTALLIGDARCSTDQQGLTAQRDALAALGVAPARIYVDHGTGTNRDRPGLRGGDRWPPVGKVTPWSSPNSTAWLGRCPGRALFESGEHSTAELADLFGVGRSTVYRAEQRHLHATRT